MRNKLLHPATLIAVAALLLALEAPTYAQRLISGSQLTPGSVRSRQIANGAVAERDLSRAVRAKLGRTGAPGPQGPAGVPGPRGPVPGCPSGTALHELACIETAQRPQAAWFAARSTCRSAGRRLPSLSELTSFEQRGESYVPTVGSEWADSWNSNESDPRATILTLNNGITGGADADAPGGFPYRCVARALVG